MPIPFIGEIKLVPFAFAPKGWALCAGQVLSIAQNQALFSLLGTYYGGDGQTTFRLPNLQGATVIGNGAGGGLSSYAIGQQVGSASVALTADQIPAHTHALNVSSGPATLSSPVGAYPAVAAAIVGKPYEAAKSGAMPGAVLANVGGQDHENRQPFLALNYIIALTGIYPFRN